MRRPGAGILGKGGRWAAGPLLAAALAAFWAAPLAAQPEAPVLSAQLTGYGGVLVSATAQQGSDPNAVAYISVTAQMQAVDGDAPFWLASVAGAEGTAAATLPGCGSVTLMAVAVDSAQEAGPASNTLVLTAPCGPQISSFGPDPSVSTDEDLAWSDSPAPGQSTQYYVVEAAAGETYTPLTLASLPDPIAQQPLTVTTQTSVVLPLGLGAGGTAYENLFYRVYAVDQNGITSTAASCCLDDAYSYGVPALSFWSEPGNGTLSLGTTAFAAVSGASQTLTYTLFGASLSAGTFSPLSSAVLSLAQAQATGFSLTALAVPSGDAYYYLQIADNGGVAGPLIPPASALLYAPPLSAPSVTSGTVASTGVELAWAPAPCASGYSVTGYSVYRTDVTFTANITSDNNAPSLSAGQWTYTDSSSYVSPSGQAPSLGPLAYAIQSYASLSSPVLSGNSGSDTSALGPSVDTPNPAGPQAPAELEALGTGAKNTVRLSWSASPSFGSGAKGPISTYLVYYSTQGISPLGPGVTSTAVGASLTALTLTAFPSGAPLDDGVLTWFWVAADSGAGPGPFSPAAWAAPSTVPLGPTLSAGVLPFGQGISLTASVTSDPDVALAAVNIFSSANSVTPLAALDPDALSTTLSAGLFTCGTPATLTAQAVDVLGDTSPAGTRVWLEPPCAPAASAQSLGADGSLTLAWSQPTGGSGDSYAVYEATGPGWPASQSTQLAVVTGTSYTVPALPGASPWASVAAVDRFGQISPASAQVGLLEPPSGLEALPGSGSVDLSWSAPASADAVGLDGYRVYYSSEPAFLSGASAFGVGAGASSLSVSSQALGVTVPGLSNLEPYAFAVASLGQSGAVSGAAGAAVSATVGLEGPTLSEVDGVPALGNSVVFAPVTLSVGSYVPTTPPGSEMLLQWTLGSYAPVSSSVFTVYEADDPVSSPQTFNTLTPVASAPGSALDLTLPAGSAGPAWYFLDVSDDAHTGGFGGALTTDARSVDAAVFAPNLQAPSGLTLAATDGRVELSWTGVPFADSYLVYRATQDVPAEWRSGVTHTVLSTTATPAAFTELADVAAGSVSQDYGYTDTDPSDSAANAYEVVASLGVSPAGRVYGPASAALTCTPLVLPQDPGFWVLPGGNDGTVGNPNSTGGDIAGVSGYAITVAATTAPAGGVELEWAPSGEGTYPLDYYSVYRGDSALDLVWQANVPADATLTSVSSLFSYLDSSPPPPLASLVYGVSAVDTHGDSSPDIVTGTVQPVVPWPAPVQEPNPSLSGLCPGGYCAGTGAVTLTWAPGVSLTAVTPANNAVGTVYVSQTAGTFPFLSWQVSRESAPGGTPVILTGAPGAQVGAGSDISVSAGSLGSLTQVTLTDLSPVAGGPLYLISAVDSQGNVGTPLTVTVSVPVSSYRSAPLTVTGLSVAPVVLPSPAGGQPVLGEQLSWAPNAAQDDVAFYEVWRTDPVLGDHAVTLTPLVSYADPVGASVTAGAALIYTVQAYNARGVSGPQSSPWDAALAPPAPPSLSLTADIPSGVSLSPAVGLSWQDVLGLQSGGLGDGAGSYTVYRGPGSGTPVPGCVGLSLSAECADLAPPQAQDSYEVESEVYAGGVSTPSAALSTPLSVAFSATAPLPPTSLTAFAGVSGVALAWTPASGSGACEYWIYRSSCALGSQPPYADFLARVTGTSFTDTGASPTAGGGAPALEPYYAVAPASPWVVGTALDVGAGLAPPTELSAFAGGLGQAPAVSATVTLLWQPSLSAAVTGYSVWRSLAGASALPLTALADTDTSYTDVLEGASAGLTDTVLTYTVMAYGPGGSSACLNPATVTAYDLPKAPVALSGQGIQDGVQASWKPDYASQGVTGYAVSWEVLDAGEGGLTQVAASAADWSLDGLLPDQSVAIGVQALDSAGGSPWVWVTPTAASVGPPPVPAWATVASGLSPGAAAATGCAIVLNVSATGQSGLIVYRSPAPGAALSPTPGPYAPLRLSDCAGGPASPYYLTTLPGTLTTLTDTSVAALYPYSYAVTALGPLGLPGEESAPLEASPSSCVAYNAWAPPTLSGLAGNGVVSLWWSPPPASGQGSYPLAGYLLYRQTGGAGSPPEPDAGFPLSLPTTQTAYADHAVVNVPPGSSSGGYGYWMTCEDTRGNQSLPASAGTLDPAGVLPPPAAISVVGIGSNFVVLQWVVPQSDVDSGAVYNIYRRLTGTGAVYGPPQPNLYHISPGLSSPLDYPTAVSLVAQSATDAAGLSTSPPNLVTECYAISVVDAAGEGPKSQDLCATPFNPIDPSNWSVEDWPAPTVVVPSSEGSPIQITLTWNEVPAGGNQGNGGYAMAGYDVERSSNDGASWTLLAFVAESPSNATAANQLRYPDPTAQKGSSYIYEIVPVDTGGNKGQPYETQSVQIPSGQNSLYVYRNSFDPMSGGSVNIQVGLQQSGNYWVRVYTLNGEYVDTIVPTTYSWGSPGNPYLSTVYTWNGTNSKGQVVASGVYLLHLQGPGYSADARVAVIK